MEKTQSSSKTVRPLKRKRPSKAPLTEPKQLVVRSAGKQPKTKKISESLEVAKVSTAEDSEKRFPVLKNEELIQKFLNVPMTNNQKGRVRQLVRSNLKGISESLLPDVIHNQIQTILRTSQNLTDAELRKLRILYNMLKTALQTEKIQQIPKKSKEKAKVSGVAKVGDQGDVKVKVKKEKSGVKKEKDGEKEEKVKEVKVKGPKRYIVFLGNLPIDSTKDMIMGHFSEMSDHIKDCRIPKQQDGKKSKYAYLELSNEPSYEFALSKNHSMLGRKRINVSYSKQQKSKITLTQAKAKAAKMSALQRSGKLLGSIPMERKRSHRRKKLKEARVKEAVSI